MFRRTLRITAGVLLAATLTVWLVAGANVGWTRTRVPVKTLDEITGIEGITYERRFVPGVDVVAIATLASAMLAGVSLLVPHKQPQTTS